MPASPKSARILSAAITRTTLLPAGARVRPSGLPAVMTAVIPAGITAKTYRCDYASLPATGRNTLYRPRTLFRPAEWPSGKFAQVPQVLRPNSMPLTGCNRLKLGYPTVFNKSFLCRKDVFWPEESVPAGRGCFGRYDGSGQN